MKSILKALVSNIFNKAISNIYDDGCWLKTLEFVIILVVIIGVLTYLSLPLNDPLWFSINDSILCLTASYGFILLFSPKSREKLYLVIATAVIIMVHWAIGLCMYYNLPITTISESLYTIACGSNILLLSFIFFRAAFVTFYLKSKTIAGVILILIGLAIIPVGFNLHGFLIEFAGKTILPVLASNIILSMLILPFAGLFLVSDSLTFKNRDERIKFSLLLIIISIMVFFLLINGFYVLNDIFSFHLLILPATVMFWVFIIALSIYKLEYSFSQIYLNIIKLFIASVSCFIGIIILIFSGIIFISSVMP